MYQEKHYSRAERLLRQSYYVDYLVSQMQLQDSTAEQSAAVVDTPEKKKHKKDKKDKKEKKEKNPSHDSSLLKKRKRSGSDS